ncbi:18.1 kDa class I heat shock protein-like [Momordica charantia]|uniref:18.1 kDa class I heat shock protein-like n=1 Tax=Momordica charantia TaxID=3673 RepID=A0A6J1DKY6_MOMCH|nr:18.1 kDa class I heat shock protein-like [Momordica charantia]
MSSILNIAGAGELLDPFLSIINQCPVLNTPTDWKETPAAHVLIADLPGLSKDQVKVALADHRGGPVLQRILNENIPERTLSEGDRASIGDENDESSGNKWWRMERCRGKFCRRFRLPENAKGSEVTVAMDNGVLTVTVPKGEVKKPQRKVIEIQTV